MAKVGSQGYPSDLEEPDKATYTDPHGRVKATPKKLCT